MADDLNDIICFIFSSSVEPILNNTEFRAEPLNPEIRDIESKLISVDKIKGESEPKRAEQVNEAERAKIRIKKRKRRVLIVNPLEEMLIKIFN